MPETDKLRYGAAEYPLYKTDREIAPLIGVGEEKWRALARAWEGGGLPARDPEFGNKRFWPAVVAWLYARNGLGPSLGMSVATDSGRDGQEHWGAPDGLRGRRW